MDAILTKLRFDQVIPPASADDDEWGGSYNDTSPTTVDTVVGGVKYQEMLVLLSFGAVTANVATLTLYESDDDSSYAEITGADGITNPTAAAGDNDLFGWWLDLRSRKRYIQVHAKAGNGDGDLLDVVTIMAHPTEIPTTDTARGLEELVEIT
jgi:hypothetical protein